MLGHSRRIAARLWLPPDVMAALTEEAARMWPLETGGVLLGYEDADDSSQLQITTSIGPGPRALHRRRRFEPDGAWQAERIAEVYAASGNVVTYLGDWHCHPGSSLRPSRIDRRTAARIARHAQARVARPLMVILAGGPDDWSLAAWRYQRLRLHAAEHRVHPGEWPRSIGVALTDEYPAAED